jgi:membrane-associated phospholipid phosphatase
MIALPNNVLINGGFVTALLWAAWVRPSEARERNRAILVAGVVLTAVALVVARVMALLLPFRERPRFTPELGFRLPGQNADLTMLKWSSFPSDHATMFFALATILFLASRKLGLVAYVHAAFVVCFPLLYLGIHYPTDVICGAIIGTVVASLALNDRIRNGIERPARAWSSRSPATFYPALYLWTLMTATQFDSVRGLAVGVWTVLKRKL